MKWCNYSNPGYDYLQKQFTNLQGKNYSRCKEVKKIIETFVPMQQSKMLMRYIHLMTHIQLWKLRLQQENDEQIKKNCSIKNKHPSSKSINDNVYSFINNIS